ncbi:MAG: ADP-ribosylglycohydrolase family protein [Clostridia bacterium]
MKKAYADIITNRSGDIYPLHKIDKKTYRDRLAGAFYGRVCGCTLGAPVEGWDLEKIDAYAKELTLEQPLTNYWTDIPNPNDVRYINQTFKDYLRQNIVAVPCDDDVGYTLLSLFIVEEARGRNFTLKNVASTWKKYITESYTAEFVALENLKKGIPPENAAEIDNPYDELIGADIRCDGYAYMAPCEPERAAKMAFVDAYISHRKNGIYGSMYFAAVISAAFSLSDTKAALEEGLKYIPCDCELYAGLRWALTIWNRVGSFRNAAKLVDERYPGMDNVHTINNACLTVFALALGGKDIAKCFANAVAMAHDADCTAATAGSIAGACYGLSALDERWYKPFNNTVNSYFNGPSSYKIDNLLYRYERIAKVEIEE